jgi:hypothetical protein
MELLIWIGAYALHFVIYVLTACLGGLGLAAGFDMYKAFKSWRKELKEYRKNKSYIKEKEAVAGAAFLGEV